jgi:sirohydrochlorin ferrochelatase
MNARCLETVMILLAVPAMSAAAPGGVGARHGGGEPAATAQESPEAIMVAAGRWVQEQLPDGRLVLDPHRTGEGVGEAIVERVARALDASVGTLEDTRRCVDVMDPSTCTLDAAALIAISPPSRDGDRATVRVYAWYATDSPREPVAKRNWELQLRRETGGWRVVSGS